VTEQEPDEGRKNGWWKLAVLAIVIIGVSIAVRQTGVLDRVTVAEIYAARNRMGIAAPVAYVAAYIVGTILAFPGLFLTLAGGLLFGTLFGGALVWIGATVGATGAFLIGRYAGRSTVERFISGGALEQFDKTITGSGFSAVFFTRIVPVFPFSLVNFAWGLTGVSLRDYFLATCIGIVPAAVVYANIAASVARSLADTNVPLSSIDLRSLLNSDVLVAFALLGVLAIVPPVIRLARARWRTNGHSAK